MTSTWYFIILWQSTPHRQAQGEKKEETRMNSMLALLFYSGERRERLLTSQCAGGQPAEILCVSPRPHYLFYCMFNQPR